jgi:hypothetical protein
MDPRFRVYTSNDQMLQYYAVLEKDVSKHVIGILFFMGKIGFRGFELMSQDQ